LYVEDFNPTLKSSRFLVEPSNFNVGVELSVELICGSLSITTAVAIDQAI
jgi:hypothetical protein